MDTFEANMKADKVFKSTGTIDLYLPRIKEMQEETCEDYRSRVHQGQYGYFWLHFVSLIDALYHFIIVLVGVLAVFPGSYAKVKQSQYPLFIACNMSVGYSIIACVRIIVSLILANVIRINIAKKGGC